VRERARESAIERARESVCVYMFACTYVDISSRVSFDTTLCFTLERERQQEKKNVREIARNRKRAKESETERASEADSVYVRVCIDLSSLASFDAILCFILEREMARERVRAKERENVCVCVCVYVCRPE